MPDLEVLELMVDRLSLGGVLTVLAEVCSAKAERVRSNWQDEATARMWDKAGALLTKTYVRLPV